MGLWPHMPGFLKLLWFAHWYVCVSALEGINNHGVIQTVCDWLNKFYGFSLLSIALYDTCVDGRGLMNAAHCECLAKKTKVTGHYVATEGLPKRQSTSVIKLSRQMRSDSFKRRLAFSFTVIILA